MRKAAVFSLLLLAAAGAALAVWALHLRTGAESADSRTGARLFQGASLCAAAAFVLAAPLFTVDARVRRSERALAVVAGWVACFVFSMLVLRAALGGVSLSEIASVAALLLAFASLALGAGLLASVTASDEISAAFSTYVLLVLLAAGPVIAGPWIPWIPPSPSSEASSLAQPAIEAILLISPLVAVSTSSGLDLMRTETVYRWTPIGQRRFQYPRWHSSLAFGLALSGLFFGGAFFFKEHRTCVVSALP